MLLLTAASSERRATTPQAQPLALHQVCLIVKQNTHSVAQHALTPHAGLSSSGTQRNKLQKDADEYDAAYEGNSKLNRGHRHTDSGVSVDETSPRDRDSKGAYWGDLSNQGAPGHRTNTSGLPEHSRFDEDFTDGTNRRQGGGSRLTDETVGGGLPHGTHGSGARDLTDRTRFAGAATEPTSRHHGSSAPHHDLRHGNQAVGGGVYNTAAGVGSSEYGGHRSGHAGDVVHDPLTSGTKGIPVSPTSGGHPYDRKTDLRSDGAPTSRNDHTGLGLAGAAVGTGAAAGYGAHELGHRGQSDTAYNSPQHTTGYSGANHPSGVPRSSMLDPEPHVPRSMGQPGHIDTATAPTAGHFSGASPSHSNASAGSGPFSSPTASNAGRGHFGPGHEGSKVLHSCQHCGRDNDISQYFSKDVVYRMGS